MVLLDGKLFTVVRYVHNEFANASFWILRTPSYKHTMTVFDDEFDVDYYDTEWICPD